jgi:hypothetical protein
MFHVLVLQSEDERLEEVLAHGVGVEAVDLLEFGGHLRRVRRWRGEHLPERAGCTAAATTGGAGRRLGANIGSRARGKLGLGWRCCCRGGLPMQHRRSVTAQGN